ncbi:MAG: DNA-directed RNA polymerase subunit omega [Holosporales bacterium]|jgi:DNA-directed RNA polymerase subunit omega|nr:DNA-directed RNA polymerase subunit omega [Holosporales bacterium]
MARITVSDCIKVVSSRFDLVVLAAQRTRQIVAGAPVTVARTGNKIPLLSLREIAAQTVSVMDLENSIIKSFQRYCPQEDLEEDVDDLPEEESYDPHRPLVAPIADEAQDEVEVGDCQSEQPIQEKSI